MCVWPMSAMGAPRSRPIASTVRNNFPSIFRCFQLLRSCVISPFWWVDLGGADWTDVVLLCESMGTDWRLLSLSWNPAVTMRRCGMKDDWQTACCRGTHPGSTEKIHGRA